MADIEIQRGVIVCPLAGTTASPGTDFGSLTSAFVLNSNNRRTHGGPDDEDSGNQEGDDMSGALELTAVDTITVTRESASTNEDMRFAWESWEYVGASGGANEFIVRGRAVVTLDGVSTNTATISGITDIDNCVPFITGIRTTGTNDDGDSLTAIAWLSGTDTLNIKRGGTENTVVVYVTVVEFTGSNWQIAHGRQEGDTTDSGTITLVDAADGTTSGGGDIQDWSTALIHHQYVANQQNGTDDSLSDNSCLYEPGSSTTEVDYTHDANHVDSAAAGSREEHFMHVIRHADMVVTRFSNSSSNVLTDIDITSAGLTDLTAAVVEVSRTSSGTGTAYGRGWVNPRLTSLTNLELWIHRSGNTVATRMQVADLSAIASSSDQSVDVGIASETDTALSISPVGGVTYTLAGQIVEAQTLTDTAVGAVSKTFASTSVSQDDGAGTSGRYMLGALVAVSSATADVIIDEVAYGTETLAPDSPGQPTASGQPATRTFTAGEWPTGANDLVVTCSGGNIDAIVVYLFVIEEVADACLPPYGATPRTDTFNRLSINPMWTFDQGDGSGSSVSMVESGGIYNLRMSFGSLSESHYEARGPNLQQPVSDGDFDIHLHRDQIGGSTWIGGLVAEVASDVGTYVFASHYSTESRFFAFYINDTGTGVVDESGTTNESEYPRLERDGDDFTMYASNDDGDSYIDIATTTVSMTIARVGIAQGTYSNDTGDAECYEFVNRNGPSRDVQDGDTALEFLSTTAASAETASLAFSEDTGGVGAGLIDLAIIAADDAAGTMTAGGDDELLAEGVLSSTDGIRYAIVGALSRVVGTTSGATVSADWSGSANASAAGLQFRVEQLTASSGDSEVDVGTAIETDAAQSVEVSRIVDVGQASEAGTALSVDANRPIDVGAATETDAALSIAITREIAVGTATETDAAQAITITRQVAVGLASEADAAAGITPLQLVDVGTATESSSALTVEITRAVELGVASETDTALALVLTGSTIVGQASETDSAFQIQITRSVDVGLASEADTALSVAIDKAIELGLAEEADSAQSIAITRDVSVGLSTETDAALAIDPTTAIDVGQAVESDTALDVEITRFIDVGIAIETNTALTLVSAGGAIVGQASEADVALAVEITRFVDVGTASEADSAFSVEPSKAVDVGLASETDSALAIASQANTEIGQSTESDAALSIAITRIVSVGTANETDTALEILQVGGFVVGAATESDVALGVAITREVPVRLASESETAQAVVPTRELQLGVATEIDSANGIDASPSVSVDQAVESDVALSIEITRFVDVGLAVETDTALAVTIGVPEASIFLEGRAGASIALSGSAGSTIALSGNTGSSAELDGSSSGTYTLEGSST